MRIITIFVRKINSSFKLWLEQDVFGFEEPQKGEEAEKELYPIKEFSTSRFMKYLKKDIGEKQASENGPEVSWGIGAGKVRVQLKPNLEIIIEKLIIAADGTQEWIVKRYLEIKSELYVGREDAVAAELIEEHVSRILKEGIETGERNFKSLEDIVRRVSMRTNKANISFVAQETRKLEQNRFNIILNAVGYGQGQVVRSKKSAGIAMLVIDLYYSELLGLVKASINTIDAGGESNAWEFGTRYFNGMFSPKQPMDEIANAIINGLKFI
jgi:hypothetical protein